MSRLKEIVERLKREQICPRSQRTYHHAWHNFSKFMVRLDERPDTWTDSLVYFTANLIVEGHPKPTIKSYVSAVKHVLQEDGIQLEDNSLALSALLKSTKYTVETGPQLRLPIQWNLVKILCDAINYTFLTKKSQPYLALLYRGILMMGYFGLSRIGEMTQGASPHTIKFSDAHFERERRMVVVVLQTSKWCASTA